MASSEATQLSGRLIGRERELAVIGRVLHQARQGTGGSLVVRGEAGIGKSAVLDDAAGGASDMVVLRTTGVEAESDLAFAGVYGLVRPIIDKLADLPATQSAALAGALGLAASADADRFLVSAAVLGLLAAAAEERPVLCVIDDAQWLDRPSLDALVFSARRLRAERLAMLFGARDGEMRRFEAADLPELVLGGLDLRTAAMVLATGARELSAPVRERLLAESAGNPLALLELPGALSGEQLVGAAPLPDAIPLTPRLHSVFRQRIERLPAATETVLLIAAADNTGDLATVIRAAAQMDVTADALDPAETVDLIRTSGRGIAFRHPLVRSALYDGATLSQRQRAHAALAAVLVGEKQEDRRVWHQAMASLTADEEVAAALEASGRRARSRAAHASAATAFLRAAELSTDESRGIARIADAAQAAWDAGQPDRAQEAISRALPGASGKLRAKLLQLSGVIEGRCGYLPAALPLLLEGARASADPSATLEMLVDAAEVAVFTGQFAEAVKLDGWVESLPTATSRDRAMASLLRGFARLFSGDQHGARAFLESTIEAADALDDPRVLVLAASAASSAGQAGDGLLYANRAVESARRQGLLSLLPRALEQQSWELVNTSSFELAYAAAEEGYRLSLDVGHGGGWPLTNMASIEAAWGREADARRHTEEVLVIGQRSGSTFLSGIAEWTLGFLELASGRPEEAATRMLAVTDLHQPKVNPLVALPGIPDAVEAAARAGRADELGERMAAFAGWTAAAPTDGRRALLARCRALLADQAPDEGFGEAIAHADGLPPFQRARTELLYGEWLRRERRRQEARPHLRAALELFRRLGTLPFERRAEAELRATGETARKRDPSTLDELTPQELQIAGLVADGLTNREVAAQLFLSPRTIDYHLRKVFVKLGIASRTDLVRDGLPTRKAG